VPPWKWLPSNVTNVTAIVSIECEYELPICSFQIIQWTFAMAPRHPLMKKILTKVLTSVDKYGVDQKKTIQIVGPEPWTHAIVEYLNQTFSYEPMRLRNMTKAVQVGDVWVLPKNNGFRQHLVRHYFGGSWKTHKPSYKNKGWTVPGKK